MKKQIKTLCVLIIASYMSINIQANLNLHIENNYTYPPNNFKEYIHNNHISDPIYLDITFPIDIESAFFVCFSKTNNDYKV